MQKAIIHQYNSIGKLVKMTTINSESNTSIVDQIILSGLISTKEILEWTINHVDKSIENIKQEDSGLNEQSPFSLSELKITKDIIDYIENRNDDFHS